MRSVWEIDGASFFWMLKTTSNVVSRLSDSLSECTYASVPRNVHVVAPLLMVTLGSQFLFLHVVVGRI